MRQQYHSLLMVRTSAKSRKRCFYLLVSGMAVLAMSGDSHSYHVIKYRILYSIGLRDQTTGEVASIPLVTGTSYTASVVQGHSYTWDVASCTTSGGGDNTSNCPNRASNRTFTVTSATPSINSISPDPATGSNSRQKITINGANFVNKPALILTWTVPPLPPSGGYIVPSTQVTFVSSTQVQMSITTTTLPDTWTVKATNPDGKISNNASFTVR
jgi:hypothetical protein